MKRGPGCEKVKLDLFAVVSFQFKVRIIRLLHTAAIYGLHLQLLSPFSSSHTIV